MSCFPGSAVALFIQKEKRRSSGENRHRCTASPRDRPVRASPASGASSSLCLFHTTNPPTPATRFTQSSRERSEATVLLLSQPGRGRSQALPSRFPVCRFTPGAVHTPAVSPRRGTRSTGLATRPMDRRDLSGGGMSWQEGNFELSPDFSPQSSPACAACVAAGRQRAQRGTRQRDSPSDDGPELRWPPRGTCRRTP